MSLVTKKSFLMPFAGLVLAFVGVCFSAVSFAGTCGANQTENNDGVCQDDYSNTNGYSNRSFDATDPYAGTAYDTGRTYPNEPNRSNSADHALGGQRKDGADTTVAGGYHDGVTFRSIGSDEAPGVATSTSNAPLVFMRIGAGANGLASGNVEYLDPTHPSWPAAGGGGSNPWHSQDCTPCCGGRSVFVNGQCVECPDPTNPPATTYRCAP